MNQSFIQLQREQDDKLAKAVEIHQNELRLKQAASNETFNDLGFMPEFCVGNGPNAAWTQSKPQLVSVNQIGIMRHCITKLQITVRYAFEKRGAYGMMFLHYEFSYTHTNGGTNGYIVRKEVPQLNWILT